jgi:transcriptional regulator with XRE-family HTH domain
MKKQDRHDTFGRRLIYARQRRDLTAAQLATLADMGATEISHYECDRRKPGADNIRKLARALDISADYLLDLSNDTRRINEIAEARR